MSKVWFWICLSIVFVSAHADDRVSSAWLQREAGLSSLNSRLLGKLDRNNDGQVTGVVIGDSFVAGVGDSARGGGYVKRAGRLLRNVKLLKVGYKGIDSFELYENLESDLKSRGSLSLILEKADFIILDVGRNDRWLFGEPLATYESIDSIRKLLRGRLSSVTGVAPVVVTAILMLPNRGSQGPWVLALNDILLEKSTRLYPADLRFDLVSKRLIGSDQLHPSPAGHIELANVLATYIKRKLPRYVR
jgi:lysophospholipase L1-like esterase